MKVDLGDHVLTFSPSDYLGRSVFVKGHFDRDHVGRLLAAMKENGLTFPGRTMLELGGNIGTHTIYFALENVFDRIVTIEPDPRNFELLGRNIKANGLTERVIAVNVAASDIEGEIDFFLHATNHGKSGPTRRSVDDVHIRVPARPVPKILEGINIAMDDIGLVWIDIEGHEPAASRSMQPLFERRVPVHTEFTAEFYSGDVAPRHVAFLARFYDNCIAFFGDDPPVRMKVRDIPLDREQFDILLIP